MFSPIGAHTLQDSWIEGRSAKSAMDKEKVRTPDRLTAVHARFKQMNGDFFSLIKIFSWDNRR